eukprot:m.56184 g.56184  ORF g.56184 m.56184 type:complete len:440 (-) comp12999_c0_seq1:124-1443(-)
MVSSHAHTSHSPPAQPEQGDELASAFSSTPSSVPASAPSSEPSSQRRNTGLNALLATLMYEGMSLQTIATFGTGFISLAVGLLAAYLSDAQHALAHFITAVVIIWILAAFAVSHLVRHPPFRIYQGLTHRKLTTEIRGAAKVVWGNSITDPKFDYGIEHEDVLIPVLDVDSLRPTRAALQGWYLPCKTAGTGAHAPESTMALVMVHGAGRDRRAFLRHAQYLHNLGYALLLCDLREHGLSFGAGHGINYGPRECDDISSMVYWLRAEKGHKAVIACGTSTGASACIIAAARIRDPQSPCYITAVVAENPFLSRRDLFAVIARQYFALPGHFDLLLRPYRRFLVAVTYFIISLRDPHFRQEPIDCVADIGPRPILFMHSRADTTIPSWHSQELYAEAKLPKELWIVDHATHAGLFNIHPDMWIEKVSTFIDNVQRLVHSM